MDTKEKYQHYVNTHFLAAVEPVVIDRGKGATYLDEEGREFLDCFSGISTVNSGHGNEAVIAAAKAQIDKLVHCSSYVYHVKPVADLAEKLASITPGRVQKSFFGNGGAEAVEGAIRLAKRYTNKQEMIALSHSFHGRSLAALSLTGNAGRKRGGGPFLPGVAFTPAPYCYRCPMKMAGPEQCDLACAHYLDEVIRFHTSGHVAFFIAEPIQGEGGIIVPPPDYFNIISEILSHHDILFMVDEVQSGFCRTGAMFASEHYGLKPDIMILGKGIANGFPLSCFIAPPEIADAFQPGDHLTTFGGNPVSCAAALANIEFMETEKLAEQVSRKGNLLRKALETLEPKEITIGQIRGAGLMVGIEIVKDAESKTPAVAEAGGIRAALREKGLLIGIGGAYGNVLRIQPPLTISENELERLVDVLKEVVGN